MATSNNDEQSLVMEKLDLNFSKKKKNSSVKHNPSSMSDRKNISIHLTNENKT